MTSDKQKELLRHMLGADSRYLKKQWGFRNHFCASDDCEDGDRKELEEMERHGFVTSSERFGYKTFFATDKGAIEIGFKKYQLKKLKGR